jgi:hypothetical protein
MSRSVLVGMLAGAGIVFSSAAGAAISAPLAAPNASPAVQVQYYPPCPPGYKVTGHGVCKPSRYLKRHPGQDPYSENYQRPRRYYRYDDDQSGYDRRYQRPDYNNGDDDGDY